MKKNIFLSIVAVSTVVAYAIAQPSDTTYQTFYNKPGKSDSGSNSSTQEGDSLLSIVPYELDPDKLKYTNPTVLQNRFQLNIDDLAVKTVAEKKDRYQQALAESIDVSLLMDVAVRPIKNTDTIYLHPNFITSFALPEGMKILYAKSSLSLDVFDFSENLLMIQPKKDFVDGNIILTAKDGEKNYYLNIVIKKYIQRFYKDTIFQKYVIDDDYLSLNYKYVRSVEFSPIDVLKKYFLLNGEEAISLFKKSGDYDVVLISGMSFYIIRDDRFGKIDFENVRFTVSQRYDYADKSQLGKTVSSNFYPGVEIFEGKKGR